jgi:hypothetical protein
MSIGDCKMQNELGRVRYHFAFFNTQFAIVLALRRFASAQGSPGGESPFRQKGPTLTSTRDYTRRHKIGPPPSLLALARPLPNGGLGGDEVRCEKCCHTHFVLKSSDLLSFKMMVFAANCRACWRLAHDID